MIVRRIAALTAGIGALAILATVLFGGAPQHRVELHLDNAAGLRSGSPVTIGGATVGKVKLHLGRGDQVIADLDLDRAVDTDVSASIESINLLGQKRVRLATGPSSRADAPDGFVVPAARVSVSTDLDQVLGALDDDTRVRLTILINQAGQAFTNRRGDFAQLLYRLPSSFTDLTRLLDDLAADDHTHGELVTGSDRFLDQVAQRRRELTRLVDKAGGAARVMASRRTELASTLAKAPGALRQAQGFLAELAATTRPLGPAARNISATAPELDATLAAVPGFRAAAAPTLSSAIKAAPKLTKLADGATPVLRRAVTPLATFAHELGPEVPRIGHTLDYSADNLIAVVDNWAHAVQFRDGLSHVFRGEASVSPNLVTSMLDRLAPKQSTTARRPAKKGSSAATPAIVPTPPAVPQEPASPTSTTPKAPTKPLDAVTKVLDGLLPSRGTEQQAGPVKQLLDYLLGP
ncbi:MAG: organic solvent transporter substrate-binding protein [Solirubrobacterales bacterium]|nr:organic solvent transporter substrate-binding protein [Solirubrobacterales bacterium]